jgi:mono/diheme cytochrome c family protein
MRHSRVKISLLAVAILAGMGGRVSVSVGWGDPASGAASAVGSTTTSTTAPTTEPVVDVHMRPPADELATMRLPEGYHLELVASDPDVICPVLCEWDGDGRMYVAEMRSYMQDINGSTDHKRISRVSRWEQTHGDGVYDKHTVFVDQMMLPRMVLPLDDRVLIRETDTKDIWCYRDTTGNGVADEKNKIYEGGKQEGNLEHQPSGLIWNLDNWIYVTAQNERFRFTHGKMEKEKIPFNTGQWGIAMTDTGRMIFNRAGSEQPAYDFQINPEYGELDLSDELSRHFETIHPIEHLTDVEGGLTRLWPQGGLNRFSGCAGGSIYRGDALPADLYGDYILPEPVGRLIRRAKVTQHDGKIVISNPDEKNEWIASTDPNFRPVFTATGPDGFLYICDMYHGIIQEANWTKDGSYLRPQIKKYGLQKNIGKGRIWRLVHDGSKPHPQPHMLEETPAQLVTHLSDPNGWWRDTAQKLIILRADKSVIPALEDLARNDANPITRLHATWTLDGMDSLSETLLQEKLKDADPRLRCAAVRIAEPLIANKNAEITNTIKAMAIDPDPSVAAQVCLSLMKVKQPDADVVANYTTVIARAGDGDHTVTQIVAGYRKSIADADAAAKRDEEMKKADAEKGELYTKGRDYYAQTCVACHGPDGHGMPTPDHTGTLAPPLVQSRKLLADRQLVARIVLHGLTGPNNGKNYPGQMASFKYLNDDWLASVLTYARNDWGNKAPAIKPADVAAVRKLTADRSKPFTVEELYSATQADAPITHTGAHVASQLGEIVLDPATAQLHGNGIHIDCYPTGLDIGYWDNWQDWVSWTLPPLKAGNYTIIARASSPDQTRDFRIHIANQDLPGTTAKTTAWDDYKDIPLGTVHLDPTADTSIEFHPASADHWGPTNLSSIRLQPTTQPAEMKADVNPKP